jgi:hypothetical protein
VIKDGERAGRLDGDLTGRGQPQPPADRPASLTVYWNRRADQGTTTPSDSCPGGSGTSTSTRTPADGAAAAIVVPPGRCSMTIRTPAPATDAVPVPARSGSRAPRANGTTASLAVSAPLRRSST